MIPAPIRSVPQTDRWCLQLLTSMQLDCDTINPPCGDAFGPRGMLRAGGRADHGTTPSLEHNEPTTQDSGGPSAKPTWRVLLAGDAPGCVPPPQRTLPDAFVGGPCQERRCPHIPHRHFTDRPPVLAGATMDWSVRGGNRWHGLGTKLRSSPERAAGSGVPRRCVSQTRGAAIAAIDVDPDTCAATVRGVEARGGTALCVVADVSVDADCARMVATAEDEFGSVHVLFNNAGILHPDDGDAGGDTGGGMAADDGGERARRLSGVQIRHPGTSTRGWRLHHQHGVVCRQDGAAVPQIAYAASKGAVLALTRGAGGGSRQGGDPGQCTCVRGHSRPRC